ncbi:MAG: hypothetical protein EP314_02975 [Bacteroidetes bacterium]|nr:MAG: hypothetical protein EP314_02975 [Bacteroidota bacterium]
MERLAKGWSVSHIGTRLEWYYKQGNLWQKANGKQYHWQLYLTNENRIYDCNSYFYLDEEQIVWISGGYIPDGLKAIDVMVNRNATKILGYDCDEIIVCGKYDTTWYYCAPALPLNPQHFAACRARNYNVWTRYAASMPLKVTYSEHNANWVRYSITATSVQRMRLDDKVFTMPIHGRRTEPGGGTGHMEYLKGQK